MIGNTNSADNTICPHPDTARDTRLGQNVQLSPIVTLWAI